MTIRDMLSAGIEIQGLVRVAYWKMDDDCIILFDDYAEGIDNQDFFDMEIRYMFCGNNRIVFEVLPKNEQ